MDPAILDTDTLSEVLKQSNQNVSVAAKRYLLEHQHFAFSAMTVYEIARGLRAIGATRQLREFLAMVSRSEVVPVSLKVLMRVSVLWAEGRSAGYPHHDADLIIGATALEVGRVLITGNSPHFDWISDLRTENWRNPV